MKKLLLALVVVALVLVQVAPGGAQEVLTNESILVMKKGGLSGSIILAKIRSRQTKFDVATQAPITLKNAERLGLAGC